MTDEESRAPGERQAAAASLYSGALIMPPPYRLVSTPVLNPANGGAASFGADIFLDRAIYASRRGVPLKMRNFVRVLSNFAPVITAPSIGWPQAPYLPLSPSPHLPISHSPYLLLSSWRAWRFSLLSSLFSLLSSLYAPRSSYSLFAPFASLRFYSLLFFPATATAPSSQPVGNDNGL